MSVVPSDMGTLLFSITLFLSVQSCFGISVVRSTAAGDIEGFTENVNVDGSAKYITRFLGIPYAESTTGHNRFMKPVPKSKFNGVFKANANPVGCVQSSKSSTDMYSKYVTNFTENCLTLNIYVPGDFGDTLSDDVLPTMVWIHGGGFTAGTAAAFKPDVLSVLTDTIVVTLNYRVGMFGFLQSQDGQFKGNQGLWDQHLALKWVNQNIGSFHGSPDLVTIFGESAGSASVLYQALYPGNKGLFQRVIAESGSPLASWALMQSPNAERYFSTIDCKTSDTLTKCLEFKTYEDLHVLDDFVFAPVVDGDFLQESPMDVLFGNNPVSDEAREFFYSLDILTGVNRHDGANGLLSTSNQLFGTDLNDPHYTMNQLKYQLFPTILQFIMPNLHKNTTDVLSNLLEFEYVYLMDQDSYITSRTAAIDLANDVLFFYPAIRAAQSHLRGRTTRSTYFYEFCPLPSNAPTSRSWLNGATHTDEIQFIFGYPFLTHDSIHYSEYTDEEKQLSRAMMTMWSNFAKTGNPNKPDDATKFTETTWPQYDMTSERYLVITNEMSQRSVKSHFRSRKMHFWSDFVPRVLRGEVYESMITILT